MQSLELSSIMSVGDVIEDEADVGESGFRSEFLKKVGSLSLRNLPTTADISCRSNGTVHELLDKSNEN